MAKYEKIIEGNFEDILDILDKNILDKSISAKYEDGSDYKEGNMQCATRIYERYSAIGGNRLSLALVLVGQNGKYNLTAITSGGSNGVFMKINTFGEESFLDTIRDVLEKL